MNIPSSMTRRPEVFAFARPAILEAVLVVTSGVVAVIAAGAGLQMSCTALVEFGMLSAIATVAAATVLARFAVALCGLLADSRRFDVWDARVRSVGYLGVGLYAFVNAILDVALPRRDTDPVSYPGLVCAVVAVVVVALVLETKYRVVQSLPSRSLFESLTDDTFYLAVGLITLVVLIGHAFAPVWWLDTTIDATFVVLAGVHVRALNRAGSASMNGAR